MRFPVSVEPSDQLVSRISRELQRRVHAARDSASAQHCSPGGSFR